MALFSADTTELEEKNKDLQKQISDQRKEFDTKEKHRNEIELIEEAHREELQAEKDVNDELSISLQKKVNELAAMEVLLKYERDERKMLVDAQVQKELGAYEMKYYHDLHTFMEKHTEKFNDFQHGFMEKTLLALKELKPVEPKVYIMDKGGSVEAGKPKQDQKKDQ